METEVWKKVRCKFFEDDYKYNSKSEIKGKANKILKTNDKYKKTLYLGKSLNGIYYKKLFNIDKLINTDFYMNFVPLKRIKQNPIALKRVSDPRVRSCSLADINTLNLT